MKQPLSSLLEECGVRATSLLAQKAAVHMCSLDLIEILSSGLSPCLDQSVQSGDFMIVDEGGGCRAEG